MAYRIPCQCGKGVFAELADAGGRLVCGCGRAVDVPKRTQLLRTPPAARRESAKAPKPPDTEATRTLSSAKWWFLAGVVFLAVGWCMKGGECVTLFGVGLMILGVVRFVRGLVQRREAKGERPA